MSSINALIATIGFYLLVILGAAAMFWSNKRKHLPSVLIIQGLLLAVLLAAAYFVPFHASQVAALIKSIEMSVLGIILLILIMTVFVKHSRNEPLKTSFVAHLMLLIAFFIFIELADFFMQGIGSLIPLLYSALSIGALIAIYWKAKLSGMMQ